MLVDLCQRNTPCQLRYVTAKRQKINANVRFLSLADQRLVVDIPTVSGRPVAIRSGETVELFFLWKGQRFGLRSEVVGRTQWRVNKAQAIDALALQYPQEIEKAQRRECFRLSLMHLPSAAVILREIAERQPAAQLVGAASASVADSARFREERGNGVTANSQADAGVRGRMMNLSETGCGIVFEKSEARRFSVGALYRANFSLPGDPTPFDFIGQIRWCRDHPAGDRIVVGVAWQLDPTDRVHAAIQARLGRFVTAEQRETLRRARVAVH